MSKISVLTPVYADSDDKLDWLVDAIQSVVDQSFKDWEMLLVDDSSPLPLERARGVFSDKRLRWFKASPNQGPAACRNTAAALAEGEALVGLDSDDLLPQDGLALMYEAWERDKSKVVYGNMVRLERGQGQDFVRGQEIKMPAYSFQGVLNLYGTIPVTAMHSKECHVKAGGWKPELGDGLEDVEYWIAAGKAGFCGEHLDAVTLLYRKHEESRWYRMNFSRGRTGEMRRLIIDMHKDVYEGRMPMGCCGGGGQRSATVTAGTGPVGPRPTALENYPTAEKVWVEYIGNREGSWGAKGAFTGLIYTIQGKGHKFEVHVNDLPLFRRAGRGMDFRIGVAPPAEAVVERVQVQGEQPWQGGEPRLATIERLDGRAARRRGKREEG